MSEDRRIVVLDRPLKLTSLDKLVYPEAGMTKAHVLDYYRRVAPSLTPHLRLRPLTLKRYPDGADGAFFYQKRCPDSRPPWLTTVTLPRDGAESIAYCSVVDLASLIWVVNLGALELHPLLARGVAPTRPTSIVFDLDPGPPAGALEAGRIALRLRRVLEDLGLRSWIKTSGRKGLHCHIPLNTPATFDQTKAFARTVAQRMESHLADKITSRMRKAERPGKVLMDWSQNDAHKTTVSVYSLRGGPRPTVATPIDWDELEAAISAGDPEALRFTPDGVVDRLESRGDLLSPLLNERQRLPGGFG